MKFREAFTVLAGAASNDLDDFITLDQGWPVSEPSERISIEDVMAAAESLYREWENDGDWEEGDQPSLDEMTPSDRVEVLLNAAEMVKAQALEAWWWEIGAKVLKTPEKRARLIAFIEGKLGVPLDVEEPEDPYRSALDGRW